MQKVGNDLRILRGNTFARMDTPIQPKRILHETIDTINSLYALRWGIKNAIIIVDNYTQI